MPSLDTAMSYHRLKKSPLDDSEVFSNTILLMDYCDNGACYNGQRVSVINDSGIVEYTIKNNIPIIDMRGSEPIFKEINNGKWMLIYEYNSSGNNEFFGGTTYKLRFEEGKFCIMNQIEIFRLVDVNGNKTYKFHIERLKRDTNEVVIDTTWEQNYNPYIYGMDNQIAVAWPGATIDRMSCYKYPINDRLVETPDTGVCLMPHAISAAYSERDYITRIYVYAQKYYEAYI